MKKETTKKTKRRKGFNFRKYLKNKRGLKICFFKYGLDPLPPGLLNNTKNAVSWSILKPNMYNEAYFRERGPLYFAHQKIFFVLFPLQCSSCITWEHKSICSKI